MSNSRKYSVSVGNKLLTGTTKKEQQTLAAIMTPVRTEALKLITLAEYVETYKPEVRYWTSKAGNEMMSVAVDHDVLDEAADVIEQQVFHAQTKTVILKK